MRYCLFVLLLLAACNSSQDSPNPENSQKMQKGEFVYRKHTETLFTTPPPQKIATLTYPWEKNTPLPKITKEYFRCKGSSLNPAHIVEKDGTTERISDCSGIQKHSLPLRDSQEFIYPVLTDLLNYVQTSTKKRVVITSGHRCPEHNTYVDASKENQYSKHQIGAEVSFYVQGLENSPQVIADLLIAYYKNNPSKEYSQFLRYEKQPSNVAIPPWYNKEVFIKIFQRHEGRNFDNRHPYPYLSLQVRYDRDTNAKVSYSWEQATRNYLRY